MPMAPAHECAAVGCHKLTRGRLCDGCQARGQLQPPAHRWESDRRPVERIRGRALQRARRELFLREPLCRECRLHGRVAVAVIRDHIVPLAEGGRDEDANIQPLCQDCSDLKTARESKRGRSRGDIGR